MSEEQQLVAAVVVDSASALTLQEANLSSSEELLLDATSSSEEESVTSSPGSTTVPHGTTDGQPSLLTSPFISPDKFIMASSAAQTLQEQPDVVSSCEELMIDTNTRTSSEELSSSISVLRDTARNSPPSSASSIGIGPPILYRRPPNWYQVFYMRTDRQGYLHMYPDLGGPFQCLQEAEAAISHHLNERRLPEICQKPSEGSLLEWRIKQCLYYPDGTNKRGPNSPGCKNPYDRERQLVKALLDQYNDHHSLCKDRAHELKDLVSFKWIYEDHKVYCHFNFTTKTKTDDGYLFFAEVSPIQKEDAWVLSCCCMIELDDQSLCYGCCHNGNHELMHPKNTRAYIGGHVPGPMPFGADDLSDDEEEDEEAYVARLKFMFRGLPWRELDGELRGALSVQLNYM